MKNFYDAQRVSAFIERIGNRVTNILNVNAKRRCIIDCIHQYVGDMKAGRKFYMVGSNKVRYSQTTINCWIVFGNLMDRIYKEYPFSWADIDNGFSDRMIEYMENRGMMPSYINKEIKCLRQVCKYYNEQRVCNVKLTNIHGVRREEGDAKAKVYLTRKEIKALYKMPLKGTEAKVRDIFLAECCTGQRFSDVIRLSHDNFRQTANGNIVYQIKQQKTRIEDVFPCLSPKLIKIMEKYDYELPTPSVTVVNQKIKVILKRLSRSVPSLCEKVQTQITARELEEERMGLKHFRRSAGGFVMRPKYELVSTHTGRRSAATNMYLARGRDGRRIFTLRQIMKVTGHKKETTLNTYLCQRQEEEADEIAAMIGKGLF